MKKIKKTDIALIVGVVLVILLGCFVMKGNKEVLSVKIEAENIDKEDIEMLEDMIVLAVNENIKQIDKEMENKLGKFGGMAGLL